MHFEKQAIWIVFEWICNEYEWYWKIVLWGLLVVLFSHFPKAFPQSYAEKFLSKSSIALRVLKSLFLVALFYSILCNKFQQYGVELNSSQPQSKCIFTRIRTLFIYLVVCRVNVVYGMCIIYPRFCTACHSRKELVR